MEMPVLFVGQVVKVVWSNGHGYTLYRVVDDPSGREMHIFEFISDHEGRA